MRNLSLSFCSLNLVGSKGVPCHYEFKPHLSEYWKIPPHHAAEFVTCMEDVLDVYQRPYDPSYPVVCMDESPKQLIGEVREPLPAKPGSIEKVDDEYVRLGVAELFLAVEPLTGRMIAEVENKRAKKDWAQFIRDLVDVHYVAGYGLGTTFSVLRNRLRFFKFGLPSQPLISRDRLALQFSRFFSLFPC